ncbi:TOG array regulator of axonemal microtubules protein 1 isoform X2 [Puntigrus tetrazona]|uniref:TOG array regulator of axonemal microtubules protein 1 isoform X2 n=1 Tax=Puntigrus tetrazona TaxID=1606681 RepID=UPI001C8ACC7C|nr:TOG array regulator of axonemal microtubules protein 1 isoform X2 [Puntigrus tetrazona]
MIYGLIPQELHAQLLDHQNYQNRTSGVEELKNVLLELDLQQVSSGGITEFIQFLRKLLDDSNFKVLYGALQLINLLVEKLDRDVERYYKEIVGVTVRALGDSRSITRHEYMNVFRQLMRMVGPQKVLDLVVAQLKHRNSRVREDAVNIITAAMLTHPRKDFDIPGLCSEAAPTLADSKKKVRHAALELFAVLDYCLDTGKKQPLTKAVDGVELAAHAEGLMAAVQARRARHILPRLSTDGTVEYALVLPRPGQRRAPQLGSGADLDWVLNGGRVHSSRSDLDLTDSTPQQRRMVSAGKGKNKLPWERSALSEELQTNGKSPDRVSAEDPSSSTRLRQDAGVKYSPSEPLLSPGRTRGALGRLRRSGSLDSDPDIFKAANPSESDKGLPKTSRFLSGSVERTFSLPTNSTPPGSFLLPSYPLTALTGSLLTPTLPRRQHADPSLSMSNTWPNKRDASPHLRSDGSGEVSSRKRSPLPPRAVRTSSVRQSPDTRNLHLDLTVSSGAGEPEDEPLDREEMLNSLRSLRNSAAKKRAKVSASSSEPDPDSPDSAVKLELVPDSPEQTSPSVTSPLSESGLSSLYSPPSPGGTKSSPVSSAVNPRASSGRHVTADAGTQGVTQQEKSLSDGCVIGQRLVYSNRALDPDEEKTGDVTLSSSSSSSSPQIRAAGREPLRALRPAKRSQQSCARDMSEGVIGRGVFGSVVLPSRLGVASSPEQGDSAGRSGRDPPPAVYGHAFTGTLTESDASPEPDELPVTQMICVLQERVRLSRFTSDKMRQRRLEQQDTPPDDVKDASLNGCEPFSDDSPSSPNGPRNLVKSISPAHQPAPPTSPPNRNAAPRLRRVSSLNRTRPTVSHISDELITGSLKKEAQDQADLRPFSKPELALTQSFRLIASDDWEKKIEGMNFLRSLAQYHPDVLLSRIHDVCLAAVQEVRNLRSGVSRVAVVTLGEMFAALQKGMDQELDGTVRALLHKAGESNTFIRLDVERALDSMVQNCTVTRAMSALLAGGLGHLNSVVRKCAAHHLSSLVERAGAARLLSGAKDLTERILPAVCKLVQDSSQEARFYGRRMLLFLSSHRDFDKMLERFVPPKDLPSIRDTVFSLKTKGLGEMPQDAPSARGRRSLPGSGLVRTSSLTREPLAGSRDCGQAVSKASVHSLADRSEYVKQMKTLLNSKDFRERMKAIDQLVCDCEENPALVVSSLFPVFDALKARLQESNSKVNLRALEALQSIVALLRDALAPVLNLLIPAVVDNHLNSKNSSISGAALGAVQALMHNVDNSLLLQPFCSKAQYLSGRAKLELIERVAELVTELYPRKPQLVEQKVLPLFWTLLSSSGSGGIVRPAAAKLADALHAHMGRTLLENAAASQPANIQSDLNELLRAAPSSWTQSHSA